MWTRFKDWLDRTAFMEMVFWPLLIIVGGFVLLMATIGVFAYYWDKHSCGVKADVIEREYKHGFWEGCLVQTQDGGWIDISKLRVNEEEEQER